MNPEQKVDVLRAACCVACVDGDNSESENALVKKIARDVGCGLASVNAMIDRAKTDPDFHKEQFGVLKEDPKETIVMLFQVAMADGVITDGEKTVLQNLANNLDIPPNVFGELISKVEKMLDEKK